jgi:hypothetical protein
LYNPIVDKSLLAVLLVVGIRAYRTHKNVRDYDA